MMDVGFESQTNGRLGELERALRETIDKLEVTEKEVVRFGKCGTATDESSGHEHKGN